MLRHILPLLEEKHCAHEPEQMNQLFVLLFWMKEKSDDNDDDFVTLLFFRKRYFTR